MFPLRDAVVKCVFQWVNIAPFTVDLCRHIVNNQSEAADQHFDQQKDGQSYRCVHPVCNLRVIFLFR